MSRTKRLIEASYSHNSAAYARFAGDLVYAHLAEHLAAAISSFGKPVLDVAGGTGALTRRLHDSVVADIAFNQLAQNPASKRVQADVDSLPFGNDSFAVAASAFGINHFPNAGHAVAEMARVAPVVGLLTWARPEDPPFLPKVLVLEAIARYTGVAKTETGQLVDEMTEAVGSVGAIRLLFDGAGMDANVGEVVAVVPWPGTQGFIDYRLSMMGPGREIEDLEGMRREVGAAIDALDEDHRRWNPKLVLGVGRRR